jgi:hypothetical protein
MLLSIACTTQLQLHSILCTTLCAFAILPAFNRYQILLLLLLLPLQHAAALLRQPERQPAWGLLPAG